MTINNILSGHFFKQEQNISKPYDRQQTGITYEIGGR